MYRARGSRVGIIERTFARCLIVRFFLFVRNIIRLLDQFSMKQVFNVRLINVFSTSFFKNSLNYWSIELTLIIIIFFFFQLINESKRFSSRFEVDQKKKKKFYESIEERLKSSPACTFYLSRSISCGYVSLKEYCISDKIV